MCLADFSLSTKKWHTQFKFSLYNKQILSNLFFVNNDSRQVKRKQQESKISLDARSIHWHYVQDVKYERLMYFKFKLCVHWDGKRHTVILSMNSLYVWQKRR